MKNKIKQKESKAKKPFIKPELKILGVKGTQTGSPDPNEFGALVGPTS